MHPDADRLRDVVVIALAGGALVEAEVLIGLFPVHKAMQHIVASGKNVPRIMKNYKADIVLQVGQGYWWETKLEIIQEQRAPSQRESSNWIPRASLIQSEAAMRVSAAGKEALG